MAVSCYIDIIAKSPKMPYNPHRTQVNINDIQELSGSQNHTRGTSGCLQTATYMIDDASNFYHLGIPPFFLKEINSAFKKANNKVLHTGFTSFNIKNQRSPPNI